MWRPRQEERAEGDGEGRMELASSVGRQNKNKKDDTLLDFCVSSLRRGHANLLCIVPILTDDLRRGSKIMLINELNLSKRIFYLVVVVGFKSFTSVFRTY